MYALNDYEMRFLRAHYVTAYIVGSGYYTIMCPYVSLLIRLTILIISEVDRKLSQHSIGYLMNR